MACRFQPPPALQGAYDPDRKPSFKQQLAELDGFLDHGSEKSDDENGIAAYPVPPQKPERFLLGASVESAELAAQLDWNFVYAGHIQGDPAAIKEAVEAYRTIANRSAILAVSVIVAESDAEAEKLAGDIRRFRVAVGDLQPVNVGSHEQALEYVRQAGATQYSIEERTPRLIRGTALHVHSELQRLHRELASPSSLSTVLFQKAAIVSKPLSCSPIIARQSRHKLSQFPDIGYSTW